MTRVASLDVDPVLQQWELGASLLHHYNMTGLQIKKSRFNLFSVNQTISNEPYRPILPKYQGNLLESSQKTYAPYTTQNGQIIHHSLDG